MIFKIFGWKIENSVVADGKKNITSKFGLLIDKLRRKSLFLLFLAKNHFLVKYSNLSTSIFAIVSNLFFRPLMIRVHTLIDAITMMSEISLSSRFSFSC